MKHFLTAIALAAVSCSPQPAAAAPAATEDIEQLGPLFGMVYILGRCKTHMPKKNLDEQTPIVTGQPHFRAVYEKGVKDSLTNPITLEQCDMIAHVMKAGL